MPFRDVVNQHHAILLLRAAVRVARPAPAPPFLRPAGPARGAPGGESRACRRIAERNHPDVRVLDIANGQYLVPVGKDYKGKEIPIDQIRALKQDAYYPPYEGRTKVYIIADAELLSLGAATSLLKLLEEPPPHVIIILIAETTGPLRGGITFPRQ